MAQVLRQVAVDCGRKEGIRDAPKRSRRSAISCFRHRLGGPLGERRHFYALCLHRRGGRTRVAELVAPRLLHEIDEVTYLFGGQPRELIHCPEWSRRLVELSKELRFIAVSG